MKNLFLVIFGFVLTFALTWDDSNGNPSVLGKVEVPNEKAEELFELLPKFDEVISPFDQCFSSWDGYLSSVKGCIRDALSKQTDQLFDAGFDEKSLAELSDYWREICTVAHPDAHELSQLGFLECYYNGRESWEE